MSTNEPTPQLKPLTSRELTNLIDELIQLRIEAATFKSVIGFEAKPLLESAELTKRAIADALKRLDHNGGIATFGKND